MDGLAGAVALVTGGNTGIGAAISTRLGAEGARVAIGHIEDADEAAALAERLSGDGPGCLAIACDVTDAESVGSAIDGIERDLGPMTILVNNAGILIRNEFIDIDEGRWDRVLQVSVYGSYRCARAVVPGMLREGRGARGHRQRRVGARGSRRDDARALHRGEVRSGRADPRARS